MGREVPGQLGFLHHHLLYCSLLQLSRQENQMWAKSHHLLRLGYHSCGRRVAGKLESLYHHNSRLQLQRTKYECKVWHRFHLLLELGCLFCGVMRVDKCRTVLSTCRETVHMASPANQMEVAKGNTKSDVQRL